MLRMWRMRECAKLNKSTTVVREFANCTIVSAFHVVACLPPRVMQYLEMELVAQVDLTISVCLLPGRLSLAN